MRLSVTHILIGILLLSIIAMELRGESRGVGGPVEGFQTVVTPPPSVKCKSTVRFQRTIWLCEDGNHAKTLLAGPIGQLGQTYVTSGSQVCTKRDKSTNPPIYACLDWERVKGEKDLRSQVLGDHNTLCDRVVSTYWEFTDNLAYLDDTNKVLLDAINKHTAAEQGISDYRNRVSDEAVKGELARLRLEFAGKRPAIQAQYNSLNAELTQSMNPRNLLRQAAEQFKCKLD